MAEVIGTASAAFALLESAILIIGHLREAYKRQKDLVAVLEKHDLELQNLKSLIDTVRAEKELRTPAIGSELKKLGIIEAKLVDHLEAIDPAEKGKVHQFAHQLMHGSKDEKKLAEIIEELHGGKLELFFHIQIASVGVISIVGDAVIANAETINRIDRCLRELFGDHEGLRIAKLLKDDCRKGLPLLHRPKSVHRLRSVHQDGMVYLRRADVEDLQNDKIMQRTVAPVAGTSRQILRNTTTGQSVLIASVVGKDLWEDIDRIEINDNSAADNSALLAYPTSVEFAKFVLDRQEKIMDKERLDRKEEREAARRGPSPKS